MNEQLIALYTLSRREITRFLRIWTQTLLPSPISMILYFVIFGNLIGSRIGMLDGVPYVTYIAPGLIMMAIINNSYANVVASFFGAKFQRNIEEMYVATMSPLVMLIGFIVGGLLRSVIVAVVVTAVALYFTDIHIHSWSITFGMAFLTGVLFSLAGMLNGLVAQKFDDINIVPTFILTPLTYLGGIFYSIDMLPKFWFHVSHLNPMLYMINAFRYGMLGLSDIDVRVAFGFVIGFILVLFSLVYTMLVRGFGVRT